MKVKFFSVFFLALAFCFNYITAQTVDEIVTKHIEAIGGAKVLDNIKSIKMTGSIEIQPGMTAPVTIQVVDKKSMRMDLSIMGMTMNQVIDGEMGWAIMPFQGNPNPEPMTEDQVKSMKSMLDLGGKLFNYKEKGTTVEYIGKDEVEGTSVYKLKLVDKAGKVSYTYIDPTNNYIIKETEVLKVEDQEIQTSSTFSNFKATPEGYVMARTMVNEQAGGPMNWESVELNPTIDAAIFKMPAKQ